MVSRISIKNITLEELYLDKLPRETRRAFLYCAELKFLSKGQWYLAGGTALALQMGHRQSVDLDFFTPSTKFREFAFERELIATGKWTTSLRQRGTIYGTLMKAKMSFIAYPFFQPSIERIGVGNIRMLGQQDIAAMKIIAVSQRGRKRDFVDLYWYCANRETLSQVIVRAIKGYPGQEQNMVHILKSLIYFDDADQDPMPKIFFDASWREIRGYFKREIPKIAKEFLGLRS